MSSEFVGAYEAEDIRVIVEKVLRDLGHPEPPINMAQVRALLDLNLGYYSTANTGLLQEVAHRIKVAGRQLIERPTLLLDAVKKAKLSALWVPDTKRILIDEAVPKPKHRWIEGHEVGHSLIPWHREFLFGDNQVTLDPVCHATVEAEANYAASRLLFLQGRFGAEARDCEFSFKSVQALAKRYGNTLTSTLWRFVEDRDPDHPTFGMMTIHPIHPAIGRGENGEEIRYFMRSSGFRERFSNVTPEKAFGLVRAHASGRRKGPVLSAIDALPDANGDRHEFTIESFCNQHALLTIATRIRAIPLVG